MAIHPPPISRTVKELYGNALRCAFPNCMELLYKGNGEAQPRMLNSQVAHICSRREGGPRWRPMTDDENASFSNLILLCPTHHTEVDRPNLVDHYSEEKLRMWKDQQVHESAGQGVELSDDEADEIVRSFTGASTVVNAMNLTVGGTGGSAPGASGGGGGAIGAGAIGGPGGPVGRVDLNGTPGQGPGAGGGGGGVRADDAVAWSSQELQTGSEGKGGVYSMDGQPGGPSSFGEHVVAPGGAAG